MENIGNIILGIMIPFAGTTLGAACVYFMKKGIRQNVEKGLLGFASGVMVAASVWSLLIPAMEMCEPAGKLAFVPAAAGFSIGIVFLWGLDKLIPHLHMGSATPEGPKSNLKKTTMLVFAVTLHNLPEGMAVSVPLRREGYSRGQSFFYGQLSGVVEPIAAVLGALLVLKVRTCLPFLLAFAAGAMIYVVVTELIPELHEHEYSDLGTLFFSLGFVVMMILDVALS